MVHVTGNFLSRWFGYLKISSMFCFHKLLLCALLICSFVFREDVAAFRAAFGLAAQDPALPLPRREGEHGTLGRIPAIYNSQTASFGTF